MLCYRVKRLDMPEHPILVYMITCSQAVSGLIKGRDSLLLVLFVKNTFRLVTNIELKIYLFEERNGRANARTHEAEKQLRMQQASGPIGRS